MTIAIIVAALVLVALIVAFLVYRDSNARRDAEIYRRERDTLRVDLEQTQDERTAVLIRMGRLDGKLELIRDSTKDPDSKYLLRSALDTLRGAENDAPMARYHKGATS